MARLGDNEFGRVLRDRARAEGINLDNAPHAAEPATLAVVCLDAGGQASYDFYLDGTADWPWMAQETGRARGTPGRPSDTSAARPASGPVPAALTTIPVPQRAPGQFRKLDAIAVLAARLLPAPVEISAGKPGGLCGDPPGRLASRWLLRCRRPRRAAGIGRTTGSLRDTVDLLPVVDDVHRLAVEQGAGRGGWRYVHGQRPALPGDLGSRVSSPGSRGAKLRVAPGQAPRQGTQRPPTPPPPRRGSRPCGPAGSARRRRRQARQGGRA